MSRTRTIAILFAAACGVAACSSTAHHAASSTSGPRAVQSTTTTTRKAPRRVVAARCPLTGEAPPGGAVPRRPALMVKVGNEPGGARPQSGLNQADVVFDTPAEGFIMRYIAVYQCHDASRIGPMRSVRWVDYHLAPELGQPILAFAGGIIPNVQAATSTPGILAANVLAGQARAAFRTTDRRPPDNLYASTQALYGLFPSATSAPRPIFTYSTALPATATPLASAELNFSGGTDVVWQWKPQYGIWLHTYRGSPDVDAQSGQWVTATNVVVEVVPYTIGPYVESPGGSGDIQSETTGSGRGYVFRNGHAVTVTWRRPDLAHPTTFTAADGHTVALAPGTTWVELITDAQAARGIQLTP